MFKKIISTLALSATVFIALAPTTFAYSSRYDNNYYDSYYSNNYSNNYRYDYDDYYYYDKYDKYDKYNKYNRYDNYDNYDYNDYNFYDVDVLQNRTNNFNINLALNLDGRNDYVVQPFIYDMPWGSGFGYPSSYYFFPPFYYQGY